MSIMMPNLLMLLATMLGQLTVQSAKTSNVMMPPVFTGQRQRVCGRSFILLVVYTCGASRWKRMSMEDETEIPVLGSASNGKSSRIWYTSSFCHISHMWHMVCSPYPE